MDIDRFRDVMIADGTVLRLHRYLSEEFEPRRGEQGGARFHLLHNVTEQTTGWFSVTDEKAHDSTDFSTGSWLENRLALYPLVYSNSEKNKNWTRCCKTGRHAVCGGTSMVS